MISLYCILAIISCMKKTILRIANDIKTPVIMSIIAFLLLLFTLYLFQIENTEISATLIFLLFFSVPLIDIVAIILGIYHYSKFNTSLNNKKIIKRGLLFNIIITLLIPILLILFIFSVAPYV